MMRRFCLAVTLLLAWNAVAHAEWYAREDAIMGTRIAVEVWHDDPAAAERAIDAVIAEMHRIDALMSVYKEDSQVSRVNRDAAAGPVKVDPELAALISRALEFSEMSGGAFDITYASVGYLYDYRAHMHPTDSQIKAALPGINWHHVVVDPAASTIRFTQPGVRIDLGGIAKGYAVDTSIAILARLGITNATVTAGGDSRILGDRRGRPWIVGIRHPDDRNKVIARIPLEDAAISTSGDYERFFDEGGRALPPHHRPEDGQEPARDTQRHRHRPDLDDRRRPHEKRLHHGTGARACAHQCAAGRGCGRRDGGGEGALLEGAGAALKYRRGRSP